MARWEPATHVERMMGRALAEADQAAYFRCVLTMPLYLPVTGGRSAGWPPEEWLTFTAGARTSVLVFSSPGALRFLLGDAVTARPAVRFGELVDAVPDPLWWLALDPALPIGSHFAPEMVSRAADGLLVLAVDEEAGRE